MSENIFWKWKIHSKNYKAKKVRFRPQLELHVSAVWRRGGVEGVPWKGYGGRGAVEGVPWKGRLASGEGGGKAFKQGKECQ